MLEMKMTTDLQTALPAEIGFNFDELKLELTERLHHYNTLVVTEDAIQDAKTDRANLRKLRDAIDTHRKDVKKAYMRPFNVFEAQIKELTALIDAPIAAIDGQVKSFDEQQRNQKLTEIEAQYEELVPETIRDIIPLSRILDQRCLNKSTTMKSITEAIQTRVKRTNVDLALLNGVEPKYMAATRAKYIETLDVNTALDYQYELAAADERFRQQEEARQQREALRANLASQAPQAEEKPPVAAQEPVNEPRKEEKMYSLRLEFQLTMRQADALKQFLTANHINYVKI